MKHYHKNPRQITEKQFKQLQEWLEEFGDLSGIVHNIRTDEIIGGNQRAEAMHFMNGTKPTIERTYKKPTRTGTVKEGYFTYKGERINYRQVKWNDEKAERANMIANKAGGEFDFDIMANEWPIETLLNTGWTEKELQISGWDFGDESKDAEPQIDRAAELLKKWKVKTGDLWQIGEHRLICGDCTDAAVVARVMGGERAAVCPTSPPYADQRDYELGDFDFIDLYKGFINNTGHCNDILVNLGLKHEGGKVIRYWDVWLEYCESQGLPLFGWYIWDQLSGFPGDYRGRLARSHEFVFHFRRETKQANKWINTTGESKKRGTSGKRFRQKDGSLKQLTSPELVGQDYKIPDSVIRIRREMARGIHTQAHPAVFSLEFAEFFIKTWSIEGDSVYEPFSGSGTTLVACQNLNRRGRAIEISPAYCAVTLQRMSDAFPGIEIKRVK